VTLPPFTDIQTVAAGTGHFIALTADSGVVAWGLNSSGQTSVPAGLSHVISIAAGNNTSGAVRSDGSVAIWGSNDSGQLNVPAGLSGVKQLAIGTSNVIALKWDGTVVTWGKPDPTQPPNLSRIVAVSAGTDFSAALTIEGQLIVWGSRAAPPTLDSASAISIAATAAIAQKPDGSLVGWGADGFGLVRFLPTAEHFFSFAVSPSCGLAVRLDGRVIGWGTNAGGSPAAAIPSWLPQARAVAVNATEGVAIIAPPEPGRIVNFSILSHTGADSTAFIAGFVLNSTRPILLRGAGPSLSPFGVQDALPDPRINVYRSSTGFLISNDDWSKDIEPVMKQAGAFDYPAMSHDAAVYLPALSPDGYTMEISGGSGAALAEVYDVSPGGPNGSSALINISARTLTGPPPRALVTGFVIVGSSPVRVLIRGIGPGLVKYGITGTLSDPKLELFHDMNKIDENDNWGGAASIAAAFSDAGAFPLEANSKDAALVVQLMPGSYTVQVSGVGGETGTALVEAYLVPRSF
jgi:hypothetical protein